MEHSWGVVGAGWVTCQHCGMIKTYETTHCPGSINWLSWGVVTTIAGPPKWLDYQTGIWVVDQGMRNMWRRWR